jgi:hypothetical protein
VGEVKLAEGRSLQMGRMEPENPGAVPELFIAQQIQIKFDSFYIIENWRGNGFRTP